MCESALNALDIPISVFPVPGGPNNNNPLGGPRKPLKMSLKYKNVHVQNTLL